MDHDDNNCRPSKDEMRCCMYVRMYLFLYAFCAQAPMVETGKAEAA